jgi:uncharacterized membrane protein YhaH (DUF805 family)
MNNFDVNQAIKYFQSVVTQHYADFTGRVSRRDFWTYVLVSVVITIIASIAGSIPGLGFFRPLVTLALLAPNMGMTARRLQDTGKNGAIVWALAIPLLIIGLVEFLGALAFGGFGLLLLLLPIMFFLDLIALGVAIYLIYLCAQPGTPEDNQYGPVPPVETATCLTS